MVYDITVSNLGNIDAIVDTVTTIDNANQNILYTIDGVERGVELKASESKNFTITVEYDKNVTQMSEETRNITISVNFAQKEGSNITPVNNTISTNELKRLAVTTGDGLYVDSTETGRYIYRGANPNNYITFNDEEWRIVSVETDGTLKIVKAGILDMMN